MDIKEFWEDLSQMEHMIHTIHIHEHLTTKISNTYLADVQNKGFSRHVCFICMDIIA